MARTAAETRRHVLEVAHELFYWEGIRATGIDRVANKAGVAPTTLYRLFQSKDDLIAAYVERTAVETQEWVTETIARAGGGPLQQILALFDETLVRVQPDRCRGCACLMTLAEFPDPELAAHRLAVEAKVWIRACLRKLAADLARTAPVADSDALGDRLALIFEGINASAQALGTDGPVTQARALVELVLADATTGRRPQKATTRPR
jgi:AcrR family transcriptional regulator